MPGYRNPYDIYNPFFGKHYEESYRPPFVAPTKTPEESARDYVMERYGGSYYSSAPQSRAAELAMNLIGPIPIRDYLRLSKSIEIPSKLHPGLIYLITSGSVLLKRTGSPQYIGFICINIVDHLVPDLDRVAAMWLLATHSEIDLWTIGNLGIYPSIQGSKILVKAQSRMRRLRFRRMLKWCFSWVPRVAYKLIGV